MQWGDKDVSGMERSAAAISGLREQIKANAVLLFPDTVTAHRAQYQAANSYLYISATEAFEVIVLSVTIKSNKAGCPKKRPLVPTMGYQAYLTYQAAKGAKRAAQGEAKGTVLDALQSLLDTTGRALAAKTLAVFKGEGFGKRKEYDGGFVEEEAAVQ